MERKSCAILGHDALPILEARRQMNDVDFKKMMLEQTGI